MGRAIRKGGRYGTDKRKKTRIGYAVLKNLEAKREIKIAVLRREVPNVAKAIGVDKEEMTEFVKVFFKEMVEDSLASSRRQG